MQGELCLCVLFIKIVLFHDIKKKLVAEIFGRLSNRNMDEINDFFDFSKPCVRKTIAGGFNNGRLVDSNKIKIGGVFQERKNPENRAHYADKYERLDEELAKVGRPAKIKIIPRM